MPDLARIGQLMGDSGRWNGKQLVPASWTRAATAPARTIILRPVMVVSRAAGAGFSASSEIADQRHPPGGLAPTAARAVSGGISPVATSGRPDARGGGRNDGREQEIRLSVFPETCACFSSKARRSTERQVQHRSALIDDDVRVDAVRYMCQAGYGLQNAGDPDFAHTSRVDTVNRNHLKSAL